MGSNKLSPAIVEVIIEATNEGCTVSNIPPTVRNDVSSPVRNYIPWRNPPRLAPRNRKANFLSLPASSASLTKPNSRTDSRPAQTPTAVTSSSASTSPCHWSIPLLSKEERTALESFGGRDISSWSRYQGEGGSRSRSEARNDRISKLCFVNLPGEPVLDRRGGGGGGGETDDKGEYHQYAITSCSKSFSTSGNISEHSLGSLSMDSTMHKGYSDEYSQKKSRHGYNVFRQLSNNFESKIGDRNEDTDEDREVAAHTFRKFNCKNRHNVIISSSNRSESDSDDVVSDCVETQNYQRSLKVMPPKAEVHSMHSHRHLTASAAVPLPITLQNKSSVLRAVFNSDFYGKKGEKDLGEKRILLP